MANPQNKNSVLPPIPGTPVDVNVATAAAARTMGVPPAVAASTIAASKAGDPQAKRGLAEAARVYNAAKKGDPIAKQQIARVKDDTKAGYAPAAQKAVFLAAAVGQSKGKKNAAARKLPPPPPKPPTVLASATPRRFGFLQFGNDIYRPYASSIHQRRGQV